MNDFTTEWVVVSGNIAIISRDSGEVWFLELDGYGDLLPFSNPMTCAGSPKSTAALLNGAIALGLANNIGQGQSEIPSLTRYVFGLIGSYHNARRTPSNYLRAAKKLREINRSDIALYLETHAREETGHDRLVIKDLRSLRLPAEKIVANLVPEDVRPLYELFDRLSFSDNPISCIGYSYCIESSAALKEKAEIDALQSLCPEGVDGSRFMRCHSTLGSEVKHVQEMIDFIGSLPAADRIEIVRATYETAVTVAESLRRGRLKSDSEMLAEIASAAEGTVNLGTLVSSPTNRELRIVERLES